MKPRLLVGAHVHVRAVQQEGAPGSPWVSQLFNRTDRLKSQVTQTVTLAAALILLVAPTLDATVIVLVKGPGVVVIGIDSKIINLVKDGTPTTGCKARQFGPFVYVAAGLSATNIGVQFDSITVASALDWRGSGRAAVDAYVATMKGHLQALIAWHLLNDKPGLEKILALTQRRLHTGVFIARDSKVGVVCYERTFMIGANYELTVESEDHPDPKMPRALWTSMHAPRALYGRMLGYLAKRPGFWFNSEIADRVRELLENTIQPDDPTVGLPVTAVRVIPKGVTWVHEGYCTPEARGQK